MLNDGGILYREYLVFYSMTVSTIRTFMTRKVEVSNASIILRAFIVDLTELFTKHNI